MAAFLGKWGQAVAGAAAGGLSESDEESDAGDNTALSDDQMHLLEVEELTYQSKSLEKRVAELCIENESKRAKLSFMEKQLDDWAMSQMLGGGEVHDDDFFKDQVAKKIISEQLHSRLETDYLLRSTARCAPLTRYRASVLSSYPSASHPPHCYRLPVHCGHLRAVMNVRENLTFEDVHDEVCRLWHLPHDRFKIVVNISDTLNLWRQYEFPPANKVQETLLELGSNEELGFGNFGLSRRTPRFLPPVFLVYQPFQARLTDRIFLKFDEDEIGYLNLVEFRGALEQVLGSAVSPRFARLIYRSYADHRGIDLEHFRVVIFYWDRIKTAISNDFEVSLTAEDAFAMIGEDRHSQIQVSQFHRIVKMLNPYAKAKDAKVMFSEVDEDQGGSVDLAELEAYWPTLVVECTRARQRHEEEKAREKADRADKNVLARLPTEVALRVRELFMYALLLVFFLIAIGSRRDVRDHFTMVDSLNRVLRGAEFPSPAAGGGQTFVEFDELTTVDQFWAFARGPVADSAFRTLDPADPFSANLLVSPLRFQTYRSLRSASCDHVDGSGLACAMVYDEERSRATEPYGIGGRHVFSDLQYTTLRCNISWYGGQGYTYNYLVDNSTRPEFEAWLNSTLIPDYVDAQVSAVTTSLTFFNLNYNLYVEYNFVLERVRGGGWLPTVRVYPLRVDMYSTNADRVIAIFEGICCCVAAALIVTTIRQVKSERAVRSALEKIGALSDHAKQVPISLLGFVDVSISLLLLTAQFIRLYHFGLTSRRNLSVNEGYDYGKRAPIDFAFEWNLYSIPFRLDAVVVGALGVRMLKFSSLFQRTLLISRVITIAFRPLAVATAAFTAITITYCVLIWAWLGVFLGSTSRPDFTLNRAVEMLYGQYSFFDLETAGNWQDETLADAVAFVFLFSVSIIAINYFLALLRDVYSTEHAFKVANPDRYKVKAKLTARNVLQVIAPGLLKTDEDAEREELERIMDRQRKANEVESELSFQEDAAERRAEALFKYEEKTD